MLVTADPLDVEAVTFRLLDNDIPFVGDIFEKSLISFAIMFVLSRKKLTKAKAILSRVRIKTRVDGFQTEEFA